MRLPTNKISVNNMEKYVCICTATKAFQSICYSRFSSPFFVSVLTNYCGPYYESLEKWLWSIAPIKYRGMITFWSHCKKGNVQRRGGFCKIWEHCLSLEKHRIGVPKLFQFLFWHPQLHRKDEKNALIYKTNNK